MIIEEEKSLGILGSDCKITHELQSIETRSLKRRMTPAEQRRQKLGKPLNINEFSLFSKCNTFSQKSNEPEIDGNNQSNPSLLIQQEKSQQYQINSLSNHIAEASNSLSENSLLFNQIFDQFYEKKKISNEVEKSTIQENCIQNIMTSINDYQIKSEISLYCASDFNWFNSLFSSINNQTSIGKLNQQQQIADWKSRFAQQLQMHYYERHSTTQFSFHNNEAAELIKKINQQETFSDIFQQYVKGKDKYFYFISTNLCILFTSIQSPNQKVKKLALIQAKNKHFSNKLEKLEIKFNQFQNLKQEQISDEQQNEVENNAIQVQSGVELLQISGKYIITLWDAIFNEINNYQQIELLAPFSFKNSNIYFQKQFFNGEITVSDINNYQQILGTEKENPNNNAANNSLNQYFQMQIFQNIDKSNQKAKQNIIYNLKLFGFMVNSNLKEILKLFDEAGIKVILNYTILDISSLFTNNAFNYFNKFSN